MSAVVANIIIKIKVANMQKGIIWFISILKDSLTSQLWTVTFTRKRCETNYKNIQINTKFRKISNKLTLNSLLRVIKLISFSVQLAGTHSPNRNFK
jgi:hypothetical protein